MSEAPCASSKTPTNVSNQTPPNTSDSNLAQIIDTLLKTFPVNQLPLLCQSVAPVWVVDTLERIQTLDGTDPSKDFLQRLAAQLLARFKDDDLGRLAPDAFICILDDAAKLDEGKENDQRRAKSDDAADTYAKGRVAASTKDGKPPSNTLLGKKGAGLVCEAVDVYLRALCDRDALTADLYHSIVAVVPGGYRISEDTFFQVVGSLLRSDIDESEKQSLLESIDYERLSEVALQQAHDSQLVPDRIIAKAALALCTKLRNELLQSDVKHSSFPQRGDTAGQQQGSTINPPSSSSPLALSLWTNKEYNDSVTDAGESDSEPTGRGERPPTDVGRDAADLKPFIGSSSSYLPRSTCMQLYQPHRYSSNTGGAASSLNPYSKDTTPGGGYLRRVPSLASEAELNMALGPLNVKDKRSYVSGGGGVWREDAASLVRHRLTGVPCLLPSSPLYWYSPTPTSSRSESATADLDRLYDELEYSLYHTSPTAGAGAGAITSFYSISRYLSNMTPY